MRPGSGDRTAGCGWYPWRLGARPPTVAHVNLYIVPRTRAWRSEEELAAAVDCLPSVTAVVSDDIRWIRSYIVQEDDGTFSAFCLYEASSEEALLRHGESMRLPTDGIKRVASTIVNAPDPVAA